MDPTTSVTLGIAACAAKGPGGSSDLPGPQPGASGSVPAPCPAGLPPQRPCLQLRAAGPLTSVLPWVGPELVLQWHALSFGKQARSWMTRGQGGCWGWLHASSVTAGVGASLCSYSVTSAKAAVNGVHLHYLRTGDGEHAVLLLPGMLGVQVSLAARPAVLCSAPSPGCLGSMRSLSALLRCFL